MKSEIHNSTFAGDLTVLRNTKKTWKGSCGSSSISSIEKSYDPTEIKEIVESLVMSKFGPQFSRRSRNCKVSSSIWDAAPYPSTPTVFRRSDLSIDTNNLSELISKSQSLIFETGTPASNEYYAENSSFEYLNQKMWVLHQTKAQILKAIRFNRTGFNRERLEAEKLLLVTDIKTDLVFHEIGKSFYEEATNYFCSGNLKISNIHLWPKEPEYFDQYFVCIVTYGCSMYASEISKIKSNGVIFFNEEFVLSPLPSNFKITFKIYAVSQKDFKKPSKTFSCDFRSRTNDLSLRESLFSLWGATELTLDDFPKSGSLGMKLNSGLFTAWTSTSANLNLDLSGFLNVSQNSQKYPMWNRQWSILNGRYLKFYNYPPEELFDSGATGIIDLASCNVRILSREECARKQTLLLETGPENRIFISCDSRYEFECWEQHLKTVVSQIKIWES